MAAVGITAIPLAGKKPRIKIGDVANEVEIQCAANQVDATPEQDENSYETYCGTFTFYKPEVWTITVTAYQSFGTGGLWNLVRPMVGTTVPFELLPDADAVVSDDNVLMTGTVLVKAFPFLTGPAGEAHELDIELAVQGIPEFLTTPPAAAAARVAEGETEGEETEVR